MVNQLTKLSNIKNKLTNCNKKLLLEVEFNNINNYNLVKNFLKKIEESITVTHNVLQDITTNCIFDEIHFINNINLVKDAEVQYSGKNNIKLKEFIYLDKLNQKKLIMVNIISLLFKSILDIQNKLSSNNLKLKQYLIKISNYIKNVLEIINQIFIDNINKLLTPELAGGKNGK